MKKSYVKDDLIVCHHIQGTKDKKSEYYADARYIMFFVLNGKADIIYKNEKYRIEAGEFIIVNINVPFCYDFVDGSGGECIYARIHPSVFNKFYDDEYFLRAFYDERFSGKIMNLNDKSTAIIRPCLEMIKNVLHLNLGRTHILPYICSIISCLDIIFDEKYSTENKSTDNINIKIIDYINRHYLENITYDKITKHFGISKPTLSTIVKSYTNLSLHNYITKLRMTNAKTMMNGDYCLTRIAELCGYSNYSTFYRTYKKYYGITPEEDANFIIHDRKYPFT